MDRLYAIYHWCLDKYWNNDKHCRSGCLWSFDRRGGKIMPKLGYFTPTLDELECADIREYYDENRIRLRRDGIRSEAAFITILLKKGFRYFKK